MIYPGSRVSERHHIAHWALTRPRRQCQRLPPPLPLFPPPFPCLRHFDLMRQHRQHHHRIQTGPRCARRQDCLRTPPILHRPLIDPNSWRTIIKTIHEAEPAHARPSSAPPRLRSLLIACSMIMIDPDRLVSVSSRRRDGQQCPAVSGRAARVTLMLVTSMRMKRCRAYPLNSPSGGIPKSVERLRPIREQSRLVKHHRRTKMDEEQGSKDRIRRESIPRDTHEQSRIWPRRPPTRSRRRMAVAGGRMSRDIRTWSPHRRCQPTYRHWGALPRWRH